MAQRQKNKKPKVAEAARKKSAPEPPVDESEDALARASDAPPEDQEEERDEEKAGGEEEEEDASVNAEGGEEKAAAAEDEAPTEQALAQAAREAGEEEEDAPSATQLGTARYVLAGFFATGMLLAYVLGRAIQTLWMGVANKDWFSQTVPRLASVPDEDKQTYGLVLGGVLALVVILRAYRRPDIRTWTDEVANELAKVKWPDRKEVQSSTIVVIAATAMATLYMAVLDRFWAFVTNIVYGDGS